MPYSISEFEGIYRSNVMPAMRLAVSLMGNEDDARDVVQDVFLKLWESNARIDNPQAFVIRSVRNACLDRLKSLSVRERVKQGLRIDPISSDDDVGDRQEAVLEAVERLLSARERQVIDMVYEEGLSYKAAAESLDVSLSTVNKSLVNAMKTLRNHFKRDKK